MKTKLWVCVLVLLTSLNTGAEILHGSITGMGVLGCMMTNYTGQAQILDQVQYQYWCNGMYRFDVRSGFGVEIPNGRNYWHTNGPFVNCGGIVNGQCMGFTHPAPTPYPTPTATPN